MGVLNTLVEFAIMRSNPVVGGVLTVGEYFLNKTSGVQNKMNGFKTYTGIIVAAAPTIVGFFGYDMTSEGQGILSDNLDKIIELCGLLYATYGRLVTKTK